MNEDLYESGSRSNQAPKIELQSKKADSQPTRKYSQTDRYDPMNAPRLPGISIDQGHQDELKILSFYRSPDDQNADRERDHSKGIIKNSAIE